MVFILLFFYLMNYLGVTSHGYSCEVCKCKVHKRCVSKTISNCKWTTLASVGKDIIEDKQGVTIIINYNEYFGTLPLNKTLCILSDVFNQIYRSN